MSDSPSTSPLAGRLPQVALLVAAVVAAVVIAGGGSGQSNQGEAVPARPSFNMLGYLDARVGVQEDKKDVRCWSSFNKLQMFITNCEIEEDAKAERIDQHMRLIQSIYDAAAEKLSCCEYIDKDTVEDLLVERFPTAQSGDGLGFNLGGVNPTLVGVEALRDYSDTIEPWRLLQTWASRQLDNNGQFKFQKQFDEAALHQLFEFFRAYDLAMLRKARDHAMERKLTKIDAEAIAAAFNTEPVQN